MRGTVGSSGVQSAGGGVLGGLGVAAGERLGVRGCSLLEVVCLEDLE